MSHGHIADVLVPPHTAREAVDLGDVTQTATDDGSAEFGERKVVIPYPFSRG